MLSGFLMRGIAWGISGSLIIQDGKLTVAESCVY